MNAADFFRHRYQPKDLDARPYALRVLAAFGSPRSAPELIDESGEGLSDRGLYWAEELWQSNQVRAEFRSRARLRLAILGYALNASNEENMPAPPAGRLWR